VVAMSFGAQVTLSDSGLQAMPDRERQGYDTGDPMMDRGKPVEMFLASTVGSAMFQAFCGAFFSHYCRLTVVGQNHLPRPPFIICSNHTSHIDSAVLMTASGHPFSTLALLGASDYFFDSWRTRFLVSRFMNVIPIDRHARHNSLRRSLAMCKEFLHKRHGNLILYPEGTRSPDGQMQTFKRGTGLFAVDLGVPVVPAHIEGAHTILAKGKFMPRPEPVTVHFGEPIMFESRQFAHLSGRGLRNAAVELLEERIRFLRRGAATRGVIQSPEEFEIGEHATISISALAHRGRNTKSHGGRESE
jgi:1-acyl-sn-glycerol-3-phosphate acyltransferase